MHNCLIGEVQLASKPLRILLHFLLGRRVLDKVRVNTVRYLCCRCFVAAAVVVDVRNVLRMTTRCNDPTSQGSVTL